MVLVPCKTLCKNWEVFANPNFIGRVSCSFCREILHGLIGGQVRHKAEVLDHRTTFTIG